MAEYLLHIGYSKTGTTALQAFLARNRAGLRAAGTLYPDLHLGRIPLHMENHNGLSAAVAGGTVAPGLGAEAAFADIAAQAGAADMARVVLSAEGFSGHPNVLLFDDEAGFRAAEAAYIGRLRALLGTAPARVVVYLRRQDLWLESMANQRIKFEGRNAGKPFSTIEDFYRRQAPRLDYARSLEIWADVFGMENIVVRPYERAALRNGSVVDDFLEAIGLAGFVGVPVPATDLAAANTALSRDVIAFKIALDRVQRPPREREFLGAALREISAEMGGATIPLVSPRLAREILDTHAAANAEIARRYLGRDDGRLFAAPEPSGTEPAADYPGLDPAVAAEIERRLAAKRRSLGGRWRFLETALSRTLRGRTPRAHAALRHLRHRLGRRQ